MEKTMLQKMYNDLLVAKENGDFNRVAELTNLIENTYNQVKFASRGMTGIPSEDEVWMNQYQKNAREIANKMITGKSLSDAVLERMREHPEIPALQYFNLTVSRPDFALLVEKWAKAFREMGVEADEVVPIYGTWFPNVCAMIFALNQIGATPYPLKLHESKEDFEKETANSKVAVVFDGMWQKVSDVFSDDRFKYVVCVSAADGVYPPLHQAIQFKSYLDAVKTKSQMPKNKKFLHTKDVMEMADAYTGEYKEPYKPGRIFAITSSSGSTINGQVKGIMSTNEAALAQLAKCDAAEIPFYVGDTVLTNLPPTASTAMFCLYVYPMYKGLTMRDEPRLSEATYYYQILKYKPQIALMTGSFWKVFFRMLERDIKKHGAPDLSFLVMPIIGGEGVTPRELEWMNGLLKICGCSASMYVGYGMSEFFSVFSVEKHDVKYKEDRSKPVVSVGLPLPNVKAGIFDKDGNELGYNQRGELRMKDKDVVMKGYYGKPELTKKALKEDGWLCSGDIAEIDENGFLYVYGRYNDITVLPNGKEMYLFDIANKIRENINIQDVMVFSIPMSDGTNSLLAHIIFERNFRGDKLKELAKIDAVLNEAFDGQVVIDGYKEHKEAFDIDEFTAKADRNKMFNDRNGYIKRVHDENYTVNLNETPDGPVRILTLKSTALTKTSKK